MMTKCVKANVAVFATLAGIEDQTGITTLSPVNTGKTFTAINTKNTIQIKLGENQLSGVIEIYDNKGRLVYTNGMVENNGNSVTINSSTFAGGIYHARLIVGKTSLSTILVITR